MSHMLLALGNELAENEVISTLRSMANAKAVGSEEILVVELSSYIPGDESLRQERVHSHT